MLMDVEKPLRAVLERLVEDRGVRVFYTGGMGEFDELFARTVRSMKRDCPSLRLVLVAPYLTHKIAIGKKEDGTMYGGQIARATSAGPGRCWYEALYDEILIPDDLTIYERNMLRYLARPNKTAGVTPAACDWVITLSEDASFIMDRRAQAPPHFDNPR